jgi:hypothetical protein
VAEFASKTGLYMLTVHKKEASLEEVFKELTGNGVGF